MMSFFGFGACHLVFSPYKDQPQNIVFQNPPMSHRSSSRAETTYEAGSWWIFAVMHMFCLHSPKLLRLEQEIRECGTELWRALQVLSKTGYIWWKTKLKEAQLDCLFPLSGQEDRNDNYAIRIISPLWNHNFFYV